MQVRLDGSAVLLGRSAHPSLLLLAEKSKKRVLFRKIANIARGLFEEDLKLAAGNLPHSINLLHELLHQSSHISLVKGGLIGCDGC